MPTITPGRARALLPALLAVVLGVTLVAVPTSAAETPAGAACADPTGGGEWRTYGGDLQNTRSQPDEDVIDASNAGDLEPAWVFGMNEHGSGIVNSTPIVADGCVYFGTSSGWVFAVNADTGGVVWQTQLAVEDSGLLCTGVVGSTAVDDGRVFAIVSQAGSPYTAALDQATGEVLWTSTMDDTPYVYNCASPVVFDGMVISAFTGDQTQGYNRGGYAIFDIETGEELAHSYTIPDEDWEAGYHGGGIWSTPAVDEATGYAYVGTSNPEAGAPEHERTNAIIKVDVDRERETFGAIVDSYKGDPDTYAERPALPSCNPDPGIDVFARSIMCGQMDLDFGASPQLFEGPDGTTRFGNLQKSGVYHVGDADTMDRLWTSVVAPPTFYSSGATAATDGESIFVAGSPPGQMVSLEAGDGAYEWVAPIGDLLHYQGVTYANGLVYTNDAKGMLNIYDAGTGEIVGQRMLGQDAGRWFYAEEGSGSTTVARNTVYVGASDFLVAYRP